MQSDSERTEYLNNVGITELRFTNDNVMNNYELVKSKILDYLRNN